MGGEAAGPIDVTEHEAEPWQKLVTAMRNILGDDRRRLVIVDELRRAIEDLPPEDYRALGYFERWMEAVRDLLEEKGVLSHVEIDQRMAEIIKRKGGHA